MSDSLIRRIRTDGDSKINTITALGELGHITSCMSKVIVQLNDYVDDNSNTNVHKQKVMNQLLLLYYSIELVEDKVEYMTIQQGMVMLSGVTKQRKR